MTNYLDSKDLPPGLARRMGVMVFRAQPHTDLEAGLGDLATRAARVLESEPDRVLEILEQGMRSHDGVDAMVEGHVIMAGRDERGLWLAIQSLARSGFGPAVAHELSNALGAILGWVQVLRGGGASEDDGRRGLSLIEGSARYARDMLRGDGDDGPVDLKTVVDEVRGLVKPMAESKGVEIRLLAGDPAGNGFSVAGPSTAHFTVLWNLMKNAVEFSLPDTHVTASIALDGEEVVVSIADQGPGIAKEHRHDVFVPFFSRRTGGTGLGLSLTKQNVTRLGGRIEIRESTAPGATFVVRYPLHVGARETLPDAVIPPPKAHSEVRRTTFQAAGMRVLVVEDDESIRGFVSMALELRGASVVCVSDGDQALRESGPFDFALVDLDIPGTRGVALVKGLKGRFSRAPVALMTGSNPTVALQAEVGADGLLRKPFEVDDLLNLLKNLTKVTDGDPLSAQA